MTKKTAHLFKFKAKLERLTDEAEYFALNVPAEITRKLGTRGPVPVRATFNRSVAYSVNLYSAGGGRHGIRIKLEIRKAARIQEGDTVSVSFELRDRTKEVDLPPDLLKALRAEKAVSDFESIPIGRRAYLLKWIDQAARPETRGKRVQTAVEEAHARREKLG